VQKLRRALAIIILTQLAVLSAASLYPASSFRVEQQTTTEIFLDPSSFTSYRIGELFNVSVNICNVEASQKLLFAQFRVQYDSTLLEPIDTYEGSFLQQFPNSATPPYTFFINYTGQGIDRFGPNVLIGILLMPNATGQWTNYPYGNGTLATITFQTLYRPVEPSPASTCFLNLTDTALFGDGTGEQNVTTIPCVTAGATYYAEPIPVPTLYIEPSSYQASLLGETFNVSVNVENLDADWKVVFAQFRVQYDSTLLEPIDTYEGSFLQQFPNSATPPYTFFINYTGQGIDRFGPNVLIGILLMPNATGQWTNYPYGNGTLATITFQTISQPSYPQTSITSNLVLNDTYLFTDLNATSVGTTPLNIINGSYEISPPTFSYEPTQPSAGEVTLFKVNEPQNPAPLTYSWNFGDGTITNTTQPTIDHAFPLGGVYNVTLTCDLNGTEASAFEAVTVNSYAPLNVAAEVGSLHFKGETAEFTVLTTDSGQPVNATSLTAKLYFNGTMINDLSSEVQTVDTGLYNVPYYIPPDSMAGEYTMLIDAEYYGASGAAIAKFTISPTLSAWNDSIAQITGIQDGVATITNGMATLTLNLASINATLTGLIQTNGQTLATISTSLGTLTTNLNTIDAKIGNATGNEVTVYSTLGDITTKLNTVQSTATTTLYLASALAAIAVILALAILALMLARKK
jgi:hypothetical protein